MSVRPLISAVVLIRNHAPHVRPCLSTLGWVDEIVVVNDGSTDGSLDLALGFSNVRIVHRALQEDWSAQMNFGIDQARGEWVFQLDVDERVPGALAGELQRLIRQPDVHGISLRILGNVFGHVMGQHPSSGRAVRLIRKAHGRFELKRVHADLKVNGMVAEAQEVLVHLGPFPTVESFWIKNALYARLEAAGNLERAGSSRRNSLGSALTDAAVKPAGIFLKKYCLEGGWRQGLLGLHYALMRAIGYYMVAAAAWELRRGNRNELREYCLEHDIPYLDTPSQGPADRQQPPGLPRAAGH